MHEGYGGLANATAGSRISARTTGRGVKLTRLVERHRTVDAACCRGHGTERISSLPRGEQPDAECDRTLAEFNTRCQEKAASKHIFGKPGGVRQVLRCSSADVQQRDLALPL